MAIENEDDKDIEQQENELATTGDAEWDKVIDSTIEQGINPNANQSGKGADGKDAPVDPNAPKQKEQETNDPNRQRQSTPQDQSYQPPRSAARKFGNLFQSDEQGNIYDTTGKLIAKQGSQRAVFHRVYPQIEAMSRELTGVRETIKNYESANEIAKREGLTLDEHGAALQLFSQWKKDPVKTMQTLLTLTEQAGKDVSTIRQSSGPAVADIRAAVQEIVQEAIKPFSFLTEQQKQMQEQSAAYEEVQTAYQEFVEIFPDSVIHNEAIANVMKDKNLSVTEAYFAVRAFAAENGLDWSKPLVPQLEARSNQQQRKPSGSGQNRQLPPMGGRNRSNESHVPSGTRDEANADDSWNSIIRNSMRDHGIEI